MKIDHQSIILWIQFLTIVSCQQQTIYESNHTIITKRQIRAPYFELLATGLVAGIAGILAPNTGKVVMIERLFGGTAGNVHAQELDYTNGKIRPLTMTTDAYCSGGFISPDPEARIFNAGGYSGEALTGIWDFTPCGTPGVFGTCDLTNLKDYATLKVARWYPTLLPLPSGRIAVMSGTTSATGFFPYPEYETNVEFLPPLPSETNPIPVPLFLEAMTDSLYPIAHVLPDGQLFLLAGSSPRVVNPDTFRTKIYLPDIVGKRTYPLTGGSLLLPLKASNDYEAEVLVCGGSSDYKNDAPALSDCGRIFPLDSKANWTMEEMPFKRAIPSLVLLPDETVFITSGAQKGWSGFGNAADPILTSLLYDPKAPLGSRFTPSASSTIGRLYHNGALLLDDGRVLIFGSTPNDNANAQNPVYPDEKRIEVYYPPYLVSGAARPVISNLESTNWNYNQSLQVQVTIPSGNMNTVKALVMTNGFVTHSLLMGQRCVELVISNLNGNTLQVLAPPDNMILPPGWYMLFILDGPTPSVAKWVQIGGDPAGVGAWPVQSKYSSLNGPNNPLRPRKVTNTNDAFKGLVNSLLFVVVLFSLII